jgi:hypothetical protein
LYLLLNPLKPLSVLILDSFSGTTNYGHLTGFDMR